MYTTWLMAQYVAGLVTRRLRAVLRADSERGALTLEWLVIGVGIAIAAGVAAAIFTTKIRNEANKLP